MAKKFLTVSTLITNLFIIAGVTRHWNNMAQQSTTGFGVAHPVQFLKTEQQVKKKEAPKDEANKAYKEPEGDASY